MPLQLRSTGSISVTTPATTIVIRDYTRVGGSTVRVALNGTALTDQVEGVDWAGVAAGSNLVAATNLAAALDALSGISASAAAGTGASGYAVVTITGDTSGDWLHVYMIHLDDAYITVVNKANTGGDVVNVGLNNVTPTALTEAIDWVGVLAADDATAAGNLAAAINALSGMSAAAVGTLITVTPTTPGHSIRVTFGSTVDGTDLTYEAWDDMDAGEVVDGAVTEAVGSYLPILTSSTLEVTEAPTWVASTTNYQMLQTTVPITVSADKENAFIRDAGRAWGDVARLTVGGSDVSNYVVDPPSWNLRDGGTAGADKFVRFTVKLRSDGLSYLDNAAAEAGQAVVLQYLVRGSGNGTYYTETVFTGKVQSAEENFDETGSKFTTLVCEDYAAELSRKTVTFRYNCEANPWGVVVLGVDQEAEISHPITPSATAVTIQAGRVLIDRSGVGSFGSFRQNPYGSSGEGIYQGGNSGNKTGGIVAVDVPLTTLNLSGIPAIDMTTAGTKYVFVANNGILTAADELPGNAVPLYSFSLEFANQPLTANLFVDQRVISVPEEQRTRGELLKLILQRDLGVDVSALTLPTENNDAMDGAIIEAVKKPALAEVEKFIEPSLWRLSFRGTGTPIVSMNRVRRSPMTAHWRYDQNKMSQLSLTGPARGEATGLVTVRGMEIINRGLTQRTETFELKEYGERTSDGPSGPGAASRANMNGNYLPWSSRSNRLEMTKLTRGLRKFYGDTLVLTQRETWSRKNPLDVRKAGKGSVGVGYPWQDAPNLTAAGSNTSAEARLDHRFDGVVMRKDEKSYEAQIYKGRAHAGWEKVEQRYINPIKMHYDSWGYKSSAAYGFKYPDDELTTTKVVQHRITTDSVLRIKAEHEEQWELSNPLRGGEGVEADGRPYRGAASGISNVGWHEEEDKLIKVGETGVNYKELSKKDDIIEIRRWQRQFRQQSGQLVHGPAIYDRYGPGGMGPTGSVISGESKDVEIKKGSIPTVATLQDDIERTPVGSTRQYTSVQAALDIDDNVVDVEHPYCYTAEQCDRVAKYTMGRSLALQATFTWAYNPGMRLWDTVQLVVHSRANRTYDVRGLVIGVAPHLVTGTTDASSMTVTVAIDYNDATTLLAGRT